MEKWYCDISSRSVSLPILLGIFLWISRYIARPYQTKNGSIFSKLWNGRFIINQKKLGFDMTKGVKFPSSKHSSWFSIIIPLHVNGKHKTQKRQRIAHLMIIIIHAMVGENRSLWWLRNNEFVFEVLMTTSQFRHQLTLWPLFLRSTTSFTLLGLSGVNRCKSVLLFYSHVTWTHCLKTSVLLQATWFEFIILFLQDILQKECYFHSYYFKQRHSIIVRIASLADKFILSHNFKRVVKVSIQHVLYQY